MLPTRVLVVPIAVASLVFRRKVRRLLDLFEHQRRLRLLLLLEPRALVAPTLGLSIRLRQRARRAGRPGRRLERGRVRRGHAEVGGLGVVRGGRERAFAGLRLRASSITTVS